MNIKCDCGSVYKVNLPKLEANLDVNIYTDGVVEGGSVPRDIKIFKCSSCNSFKYVAACEKTNEDSKNILEEPTSSEYYSILEDENFNSNGLRIKAWQKSNDRYRNLDSAEDIGVKIELLKATISSIPSVQHFDEYILKMEEKAKDYPSDILDKKIEELKEKKEEVLNRTLEKKRLTDLEEKQKDLLENGEKDITYNEKENSNMNYLLKNLGDSEAELLIKGEIYRNLGNFEASIETLSNISSSYYKNIVDVIVELDKNKSKKVSLLKN